MKDNIICLAIGILVATAGVSFAQSFTEFLNVRVLEDTELEGDADIQGELSDSTDSQIDLADGTDLSMTNGDLGINGGSALVSSPAPLLQFGETDTGDSWAWIMQDSDLTLSYNMNATVPLTFDIGGDPDTALFSSPWDVEIEEDLSVGTNLNVTGDSTLDGNLTVGDGTIAEFQGDAQFGGFISHPMGGTLQITSNASMADINADFLRLTSLNDEKLRLTDGDAVADEGEWSFASDETGALFGYAQADDGTVGDSWFNVGRTGTTVDSVNFPNGPVTIGDSLSWGGGSAISTSDDVVTGTGGTLSLFDLSDVAADPDADRYAFWDDSAGELVWDSLINDTFLSSNVALYDQDMSSFSTGTLSDARLSVNVALYNRVTSNFTGTLEYGGVEVSTVDASTLTTGTLANARLDQQLQDVAGLGVTDGNFIVGDGSNWVAESGATARASLGANDASNLTTGTLPDARLSSNVPLLDQINLWSNEQRMGIVGSQWEYRHDADAGGQRDIWQLDKDSTRMWELEHSYDDEDVVLKSVNASGNIRLLAPVVATNLAIGAGQTISNSDNVALLDSTTEFTGGELAVSASLPRMELKETDAATDEIEWRWQANDGQLEGMTRTDSGAFGDLWLEVNRTGTTVDSVNIPSGTLQSGGTEVATQESGEFPATLTGFSESTTGTIHYSISGNVATLWAQSAGIDGTSNSTSMGMTGIPSVVQPDQPQCVTSRVRDVSNTFSGETCIGTTGDADFALAVDVGQNGPIVFSQSGFTASGSKGVPNAWTITYPLE